MLYFPQCILCCGIHTVGRGAIIIALTNASLPAKRRILTTCVKLFLEQGYKKTTVAEIISGADVSCSSFQNIFHAKDGVLLELVEFMFENQFSMARSTTGAELPPVYVYAAETAIQMTLTELNENLREIYLEAYTHPVALGYIQKTTAKELYRIFSPYQPQLVEQDFYHLEFGSAGLMRGYMANRCTEDFPLEEKLRCFLTAALRVYHVPEEELQGAVAFVLGLDIRGISQKVMETLFRQLAMHYEFSLSGILPEE